MAFILNVTCLTDRAGNRPYFSRPAWRWIEGRAVLSETVVVLDFETTGLRADLGDRVTEVAALRLHGGQVVARYETLVNCDVRVPLHIKQFTGITQDMVDSGAPPTQAFSALLNFIGDDPVISHNAAFDQGFLDCECERLQFIRSTDDFICTVQLARALFPELPCHALGALASRFGLPYVKAHRAGADAQATINVLMYLTAVIRERYATEVIDATTLRHVIDSHAVRVQGVREDAVIRAA